MGAKRVQLYAGESVAIAYSSVPSQDRTGRKASVGSAWIGSGHDPDSVVRAHCGYPAVEDSDGRFKGPSKWGWANISDRTTNPWYSTCLDRFDLSETMWEMTQTTATKTLREGFLSLGHVPMGRDVTA